MKSVFSAAACAGVLFAAQSAFAQPPGADDGFQAAIGGGVMFAPSYVGDDDYQLSVLPNIQFKYGDRFFASVQEGVGYNIVNTKNFRAGPIARIAFPRNEDGDQPFVIAGDPTTDLIGLGDVSATAELGGFVEYRAGALSATLEARQGVNGHNGFVGDMSVNYRGQRFALGRPLIYSIGPRLRLVDDSYQSAYFGVTPAQSLASGLPEFDADGGLHSYGIGATIIRPIDRAGSVNAVFVAGYDRLAGDAGDAPLVRERGARDQLMIGVFFSYSL